MPRRSPAERLVDTVSLFLLAGGAALVGWAWWGLGRLADEVPAEQAAAGTAVALAERYAGLQTTGAVVMGVGLAGLVVGWWVGRKARRND